MEGNVEQQIVRAARKVFLAHGYNETNMAMIAQEAGIARPAMYYYFRSKDRIFEAVFHDIIKDFFPSVMGILHQDAPMADRLEQFVDAYIEQLRQNPQLPLFVLKEINRDPERIVRTVLDDPAYSFPKVFLNFYQEAVAAGQLRPQPVITIPLTIIGQLVAPFLSRPVIDLMTENRFDEALACWKPYVVDNLKRLLLP